jgi:ubiquinone/menaquinone biosynthesis C-methylase UbiE/uncharacterized protein YbaR (Trm112 family)
MKESIVRQYLLCPACKHESLEVTAFQRTGDEVHNGVVSCPQCATWYRLEENLLELLVPALQDFRRRDKFRQRYGTRWQDWESATVSPARGDTHKIGQREFYDVDVVSYENNMLKLPFWRGFDRTYLSHIEKLAEGRPHMLEIGGGTGRISLPLADRFTFVLSFDISEGMAREAMRKRDALTRKHDHIHYFVADAENIPVKSGTFDVAVFSGILHHVEHPEVVMREMARTLNADGRFIGMENNRSALRPVFDALMVFKRLWNEKASDEHYIIGRQEILRWFEAAGVTGDVWTSVFLPPHVYNLFSDEGAERLIRRTDEAAHAVPWYREQGGLILFSGRKATTSADAAVR